MNKTAVEWDDMNPLALAMGGNPGRVYDALVEALSDIAELATKLKAAEAEIERLARLLLP